MDNKKMTSQGMDERANDEDDDDDTDKPPVVVENCELRNTEILEKYLSTTEIFGLGTMITINKRIPGVENSDDNALAVIVTTKNSIEGKYNEPMNIPEGLFDMDLT